MKRKNSLFSTICSLLLICGTLTYCVWATTIQNVGIHTNVSYTPINVEGSLTAYYSNDGGTTKNYYDTTQTDGLGGTSTITNTITTATTSLSSWAIPDLTFSVVTGVVQDIQLSFSISNTSATSDLGISINGTTQFPSTNVLTSLTANGITAYEYTAKQNILAGALTIDSVACPAYSTNTIILTTYDPSDLALVADTYYVATNTLWVRMDAETLITCATTGTIFTAADLSDWIELTETSQNDNLTSYRAATLDDIVTTTSTANSTETVSNGYTNSSLAVISPSSSETFTIVLHIIDSTVAVTSTALAFNLVLGATT